jgi:hypothetical protein
MITDFRYPPTGPRLTSPRRRGRRFTGPRLVRSPLSLEKFPHLSSNGSCSGVRGARVRGSPNYILFTVPNINADRGPVNRELINRGLVFRGLLDMNPDFQLRLPLTITNTDAWRTAKSDAWAG